MGTATTARYIDQQVHKDFNLISLSFWLFIGDIGSVAGSNTWMYFENSMAYCDGAPGEHGWLHMCLKES